MALADEDDAGRPDGHPDRPELVPVRVEDAERPLAEREQALTVVRPDELGRRVAGALSQVVFVESTSTSSIRPSIVEKAS